MDPLIKSQLLYQLNVPQRPPLQLAKVGWPHTHRHRGREAFGVSGFQKWNSVANSTLRFTRKYGLSSDWLFEGRKDSLI